MSWRFFRVYKSSSLFCPFEEFGLVTISSFLLEWESPAGQDTALQAVKDVSTGLKALVKKSFEKKPQAEMTLAEYEKETGTWERPLQKSLDHVDTFGNAVEKAVTPPVCLGSAWMVRSSFDQMPGLMHFWPCHPKLFYDRMSVE